MLVSQRIGKPGARSKIVRLKWELAGRREQRTGDQPRGLERLQIPAYAEVQSEPVRHANGVLRKGGVLIGVRMRGGAAEILEIVVRDLMRVGAKGAKLQSALPGFECERVDLDGIEKVFTTLLAGEEVIDRR